MYRPVGEIVEREMVRQNNNNSGEGKTKVLKTGFLIDPVESPG